MGFRQTIVRYKFYHLLFWIAVGCIWFYLRYQDYATLQQALWITLIKVTDLAALIYFSNGVLVPRLLYRKKWGLFAAAFVATVVVSSFYKMMIMGNVLQDKELLRFSTHIKDKIYNHFITHIFLVSAGIAVKLVVDYIRLQKQLVEVAKEKAEAELNFLKSQVNPHFLFNSLNAVYFLIDKRNAPARDALHKFSDLLRYQLYECNAGKIAIEKEIGFLKDYVALQQLRLNDDCSVHFNCAPEVQGFSIQPLLLIPFVENSFKHLSHYTTDVQNMVRINLSRTNGTLLFSVYNTKEEGHLTETRQSGGIGLNNVKKRLHLLYPHQHQLTLNDKDGWFGIELNLSIYK